MSGETKSFLQRNQPSVIKFSILMIIMVVTPAIAVAVLSDVDVIEGGHVYGASLLVNVINFIILAWGFQLSISTMQTVSEKVGTS
jgi:large-conductance mechanosensitive channel